MADVLITFRANNNVLIDNDYFDFTDYSDTQEMLEAIQEKAQEYNNEFPDKAPVYYVFDSFDELPEAFDKDTTGSLEANLDKVYKYIEAVTAAKLSDDEIEALTDFAAYHGHDLEDAADYMREFENTKQGKYDDEADFGQRLYEDIYGEITGELQNFINWQGYGESLLKDDYYKTENGYYFRVY